MVYTTWLGKDKISYFGIVLTKGKYFTVDLASERRSFFSSVNSIPVTHFASDMVNLYYCEPYCNISLRILWWAYHFQMLHLAIFTADGRIMYIVKLWIIDKGNQLAT
jgi:hypothetical protein